MLLKNKTRGKRACRKSKKWNDAAHARTLLYVSLKWHSVSMRKKIAQFIMRFNSIRSGLGDYRNRYRSGSFGHSRTSKTVETVSDE